VYGLFLAFAGFCGYLLVFAGVSPSLLAFGTTRIMPFASADVLTSATFSATSIDMKSAHSSLPACLFVAPMPAADASGAVFVHILVVLVPTLYVSCKRLHWCCFPLFKG